ncbi:hypothetical protein FB451DRAFT_1166678 [Mycena latifolia]|nr:hypothetical protein FB451DRAFT_1166678 [Mycena latifolia]
MPPGGIEPPLLVKHPFTANDGFEATATVYGGSKAMSEHNYAFASMNHPPATSIPDDSERLDPELISSPTKQITLTRENLPNAQFDVDTDVEFDYASDAHVFWTFMASNEVWIKSLRLRYNARLFTQSGRDLATVVPGLEKLTVGCDTTVDEIVAFVGSQPSKNLKTPELEWSHTAPKACRRLHPQLPTVSVGFLGPQCKDGWQIMGPVYG